jgi:DNA polymerase-3 subunit delta'
MSEAPPPRANPGLRGQARAEAALLAAWNSGRMPHAWLICGPRGVGKATLAFRFARFVLAQPASPASAAAGLFGAPPPPSTLAIGSDHPVFRRVASGGHADLQVLEPGMIHPETGKETAEIVVEHVRGAIGFLAMTPAEGGWRVLVVDQAEAMNRNAENALLKILEEPHSRSLLMLISHAPGRLLPTIRSRCRRLDMPALDPAIVAELLGRQHPDLAGDRRDAIARIAGGSIGRAAELVAADALELYEAILGCATAQGAGTGAAIHALGASRRLRQRRAGGVQGLLRTHGQAGDALRALRGGRRGRPRDAERARCRRGALGRRRGPALDRRLGAAARSGGRRRRHQSGPPAERARGAVAAARGRRARLTGGTDPPQAGPGGKPWRALPPSRATYR